MEFCLYFIFGNVWIEQVKNLIFNLLLKTAFSKFDSINDPRSLGQVSGILAIFSTETNVLCFKLDWSRNWFKRIYKNHPFPLLKYFIVIESLKQMEKILISLKPVKNKLDLLILKVQNFIDIIGNALKRLISRFSVTIVGVDLLMMFCLVLWRLWGQVNLEFFLWLLY